MPTLVYNNIVLIVVLRKLFHVLYNFQNERLFEGVEFEKELYANHIMCDKQVS